MSKMRWKIETLNEPIEFFGSEYKYNVSLIVKMDDGKEFYCGVGRFCETMDEATKYIENYEKGDA